MGFNYRVETGGRAILVNHGGGGVRSILPANDQRVMDWQSWHLSTHHKPQENPEHDSAFNGHEGHPFAVKKEIYNLGVNVRDALNDLGKPVKGSHIHILGVAYKQDIDDMRESPALDIIQLLERRGARVTYSDPHVPHVRFDGLELCSDEAAMDKADCLVIVTAHSGFDYKALVGTAPLIVDTRNALKGVVSDKIVRL